MTTPIRIIVEPTDRYTRLRAIDWWDQERLRRARVLVAGAGALGNEVLKNLALAGVGHILLVDFDRIDVTNLARAILFRPGDETQPKATLAARRIREINPDVDIQTIEGDVVWDVGLGLWRRFDAVMSCVDNREARLGINRNCWKVGVPWIDGALSTLSGQVRIFVPPDSACYECSFTEQDYAELRLRYSCQLLAEEGILAGHAPTTPTSASIIAAIQTQELFKLLHRQSVLAGYELEFDGQQQLYRKTQLTYRSECPSHDTLPLDQVISLPEARAAKMTGGELLARVRADLGDAAYIQLDREIITALVCPNGHGIDQQVRPRHRTGAHMARCPECGVERLQRLTHRIEDEQFANLTLAQLGVPPGHIVLGRNGEQERYYELDGDLVAYGITSP